MRKMSPRNQSRESPCLLKNNQTWSRANVLSAARLMLWWPSNMKARWSALSVESWLSTIWLTRPMKNVNSHLIYMEQTTLRIELILAVSTISCPAWDLTPWLLAIIRVSKNWISTTIPRFLLMRRTFRWAIRFSRRQLELWIWLNKTSCWRLEKCFSELRMLRFLRDAV